MKKNVSYRDILRCKSNRLSQRQAASACGCGRTTVQEVYKIADEKGIAWGDVVGLTDKEAFELIRGRPPRQSDLFAEIDFDWVGAEMAKDRTMTLTLLWEEYAALAARNGGKPYKYSRFCELYAAWRESHDVSMTRRYVPGDLGEFDYAGQTMEVVTDDGEVLTAYLFVACLPFSQYSFVKAYPQTQTEDWCLAGSEAFAFFSGAPRLLTIDNLHTGVTKHTAEEIVLNRTYRDFAEHYNVAVIPHAPYYPRGKASVESSVGKIANKIRNMLRGRRFFTFAELNDAIAEKLADLNTRKLQKKPYSRSERFEEVERAALQPLPSRPFELSRWSPPVKVPSSYHVMLAQDGVYYSVPYRYVGRRVELRSTATVVEIYCDGERVASHPRNRTAPYGEHVTDLGHRPRSHADFADHDSTWYRSEAEATGPATLAVVEGFLSAGIAEEQGWQWCEKLLRRRESLGADVVEDACATAIAVTRSPSYKTICVLLRNRAAANKADEKRDDGRGGGKYALHRY